MFVLFVLAGAATLAAPWTGVGVGSWGLLAVGAPRGGVGKALVAHCEQYLRLAMLEKASIEYFCIAGHPSSERLKAWYETKLGYAFTRESTSGKSYRGNEVDGEVFFRHASKPLDISEYLLRGRNVPIVFLNPPRLWIMKDLRIHQFAPVSGSMNDISTLHSGVGISTRRILRDYRLL